MQNTTNNNSDVAKRIKEIRSAYQGKLYTTFKKQQDGSLASASAGGARGSTAGVSGTGTTNVAMSACSAKNNVGNGNVMVASYTALFEKVTQQKCHGGNDCQQPKWKC